VAVTENSNTHTNLPFFTYTIQQKAKLVKPLNNRGSLFVKKDLILYGNMCIIKKVM